MKFSIRKRKIKRIRNMLIFLIIVGIWLLIWYCVDVIKYSEKHYNDSHWPEWLEKEICITKDYNLEKDVKKKAERFSYYFEYMNKMESKECPLDARELYFGPSFWNTQDRFQVVQLEIRDAETGEQIKEKETLEKLLSLFQRTKDTFIYDEKYFGDGKLCLYYDGIAKANQRIYLFAGFQGTEDPIYSNGKQIQKIQLISHTHTIQADKNYTIHDILSEAPFCQMY